MRGGEVGGEELQARKGRLPGGTGRRLLLQWQLLLRRRLLLGWQLLLRWRLLLQWRWLLRWRLLLRK